MSDYKNLDGIGNEVTEEQVEMTLDVLRRMMSQMETDSMEVYDCVRVLEVLYDEEPEPPSETEMLMAFEVVSNVDPDEVKSLEPKYVQKKLAETQAQLRKAESASPE